MAVMQKIGVSCVMDIGPRSSQQDCLLAGADIFQEKRLVKTFDLIGPRVVLSVCDGLGGHAGGEAASRFACERLAARVPDCPAAPESLSFLLAEIQKEAQESSLDPDAGSTVAGMLVCDDRALIFNAGDSRVYKLSSAGITRLSHDHSFVQRMVDGSLLTKDEAFSHPFRNLVDLGVGPTFSSVWGKYTAHIHEEALKKDTWFLLCSDGLHDVLTESRIHEILMPDPLENSLELLAAAKAAKWKDNTSYIIARVDF